MASKSRPLPLSRTDWRHVVPLLVVALTAGFAAQTVLRFWAWWRSCTDTHHQEERRSMDHQAPSRPPPCKVYGCAGGGEAPR